MKKPVVPNVVVIPAVATAKIAASATRVNDKKRSHKKRAKNNEVLDSSIPDQLEKDRRQGQDMLRQLVYGDAAKPDNVDFSLVDWKAVIELAGTLHKREQRLLKRLEKNTRSPQSIIITRSQSTDTDPTVSAPSTPQSVEQLQLQHRTQDNDKGNHALSSTAAVLDEHPHQTRAALPTNNRSWLSFFFPWRRSSRNKAQSQAQASIQNPSSYSINLISCTAAAATATATAIETKDTKSPFCTGGSPEHESQQEGDYSTPPSPPTIQRQGQLQQVVAVGCHAGIFASFRRSNVNVDTELSSIVFYDAPADSSSSSPFQRYPVQRRKGPLFAGEQYQVEGRKVPSSTSTYPTDQHYASSMSLSTLEEDLNLIEKTEDR